MKFNIDEIRDHFPALQQKINGRPLIYLDSAASALREKGVIESIHQYYMFQASNVHRGAHHLSDVATTMYEEARKTTAQFINAKSPNEVVFTRGTTESLNLVARSYAAAFLNPEDEIVLTQMEHHSNIIPWQIVAKEKGFKIKVIPITDNGELDLSQLDDLFSSKVKLVSLTVCSNTLGTINPIEQVIARAHALGAKVVLDAAQSVSFIETDVQKWDCDFLALSGHKIFGPNGIGILYGKEELLNSMPPYQGGGSMISHVTFDESTYLDSPQRFEAGTPHVAGAIGLGKAFDFIQKVGIDTIGQHEEQLIKYATDRAKAIEGLRVIGEAHRKSSILSFVIEGIHPMDVGGLLDQYGIAVRVGQHCTQPLMDRLGLKHGTVRASFSVYNTEQEVDHFIDALEKVKGFF